ncbi:MAG: TauD/TfdA family dioxygenase [Gammaproteobacteria bacterium]
MNNLAEATCDDLEMVGDVPLLMHVDATGQKVLDWAKQNQPDVERLVRENGALLLRGLNIMSSRQFGQLLSSLFDSELIEYSYRSTPRTELRGRVYTATEYHSDQVIPQHNENAYSNRWPMRIGFLCTHPAETGGATPISDSRVVRDRLPDKIRQKFEDKGVMYVRNYSDIDLPWTGGFQTEERSDVEAVCSANDITFERLDDNALRTTQVNPAVATHPDTNMPIWFNQAHLFHVTNLDPDTRASMLNIMSEDRLPKNTYYGDGSPIEPEHLDAIRALYQDTKIAFEWQRNDLMLLDNMMFTHGREAYTGSRQVLVGMARPNGH